MLPAESEHSILLNLLPGPHSGWEATLPTPGSGWASEMQSDHRPTGRAVKESQGPQVSSCTVSR